MDVAVFFAVFKRRLIFDDFFSAPGAADARETSTLTEGGAVGGTNAARSLAESDLDDPLVDRLRMKEGGIASSMAGCWYAVWVWGRLSTT